MATHKIIGAAHWASYIINGDESGLSEQEMFECDRWLERELMSNEDIVDCGEPYFSWSYDLYTYTDIQGGDLVEYTVITR